MIRHRISDRLFGNWSAGHGGTGGNEHLAAAQELRHGNANFTASIKSNGAMIRELSAPMLFDYMAIVMDKQALAPCTNITVTLAERGRH